MKILYLSLSTDNYAPNYYPFLRKYVNDITPPDVEVEVRGTYVGILDSYRFFEFLDTTSVVDQVLYAANNGYSAVVLGNMLDPGLREARSMVDIPVLGLAETSMLTACMMGDRFSLIMVNRYFKGRFEENVRRMKLEGRLSAIDTIHFTPHELDQAFSEPDFKAKAREEFFAGARNTIAKGADVIIPGGGRLVAWLASEKIHEVDGVPVINGIATLLSMALAAVKIREITGTFVSRQGLYVKPPAELVQKVAEQYSQQYGLRNLKK